MSSENNKKQKTYEDFSSLIGTDSLHKSPMPTREILNEVVLEMHEEREKQAKEVAKKHYQEILEMKRNRDELENEFKKAVAKIDKSINAHVRKVDQWFNRVTTGEDDETEDNDSDSPETNETE